MRLADLTSRIYLLGLIFLLMPVLSLAQVMSVEPDIDTLYVNGGSIQPRMEWSLSTFDDVDSLYLYPGNDLTRFVNRKGPEIEYYDSLKIAASLPTHRYSYKIKAQHFSPDSSFILAFDSTFGYSAANFEFIIEQYGQSTLNDTLLTLFVEQTYGLSAPVYQQPDQYRLYPNYPNPFNPITNIKFSLPKQTKVELKVFNLYGREISTLVNKRMNQGVHTVIFEAGDLSSGTYIYRLEAGPYSDARRMLLIK